MPVIKTYPMSNSAIVRVNYISDRIDTNPPYQRNSDIWDIEKRQLLIDSILNDFDIPKIYFHALTTPRRLTNGKDAQYAIIDGKQRMETLFKFLKDDLPLADEFVYYDNPKLKASGLKYSEMAAKYPELKVAFDSYVLPVILVETNDLDLIDEMFSRLNEAVPLSSAEKRNAFGGPLPKIIKEVAQHDFFVTRVKFSNKRYQHREVAVRLLFLEKCILSQDKIVDTKRIFLDTFVKEYKKNDAKTRIDQSILKDAVELMLDLMSETFTHKDPLLGSQATIPIYYLLFRYAKAQQRVDRITRSTLSKFAKEVADNMRIAETDIAKADFDLLQFDRLSIQGTNDASSIKERLRIIMKRLGLDQVLFQ
ncbi:DUF262 domain-containing protein [Candidatus Bathyarchaeota archaeon]|nr:DUF262 domain-containing protein [Candidatus Bathyarchaeota archaeon]